MVSLDKIEQNPELHHDGWDSYDAAALVPEAIKQARLFEAGSCGERYRPRNVESPAPDS